MKTLADIVQFLNQHTDFEKQQGGRTRDTFDLERMHEMLDRLIRPDLSYSSAHVAGTKGKGATSRYLASMLRACAVRTGLFTSPHLERLTQRIEIDGQEITEEAFVAAFEPIVAAQKNAPGGAPDMTFFELLTLSAMTAFHQAKVAAGVFEVGLGGRLDSTNVIAPDVTVITEIAIDHTRQLGDTIAEIAREKAGIIKPGVPVVCLAKHPEARRVIAVEARDQEAPVLMFGKHFDVRDIQRDDWTLSATLEAGGMRVPVRLPTPAVHMLENAAAALCAMQVMANELDLTLDPKALGSAIETTTQGGRFERFTVGGRTVVVDSAHNELSVAVALKTARAVHDGRLVVLMGLASDKQIEACLKAVAENADALVATRYYNRRESDPSELASLFEKFKGRNVSVEEHPEAALEEALSLAGESGMVLVTGSTYLAGLLRPVVKEQSDGKEN